MKTLTTQYALDMISLDSEIDRLNTQYQHLLDAPAFSAKWKKVKEHLEGMIKEITIKKQAKFVKDKLAFSEGFVYKWSRRSTGRRGFLWGTQPRNSVTDQSESD